MAMGTHKLQLIWMCLYSIKKPLQLLISDPKLGILVSSGNVRMDLIKAKDREGERTHKTPVNITLRACVITLYIHLNA